MREESPPLVAVVPARAEIEHAVVQGGGRLADAREGDALVWMDPSDPEGLRTVLASSPARWVQLPFAGIEEFLAAGVIEPGRTWTCAKGIYGPSTAEHALALVLLAARELHRHVRARRWRKRGDAAATRRLAGGTVLIVGTGGIGRALAGMLAPLGPRVIAANRGGRPMAGAERTVRVADLPGVVAEADWIVLAPALTPETERLFDAAMLARLKPEAWIVNVGRGRLIDTPALVDALRDGRIAGAALDVTDPEPLPDGHPLWNMENVVITSHAANTWAMAVPELAALVERNVARFARGEKLEGLVDLSLGY
jgi:phosphoglycerate dehydrogenase-like enzyme